MAQIFEFPGVKKKEPAAMQLGTVYECSRCQARDQLFKLYTDGRVQCGDCGVEISNIRTNYPPKGAA